MHDEIIRFSYEGEIADSGNLVSTRERLLHDIDTQMRDEGITPNLDLDPQFTLDYNPDTETYKFALSVYGVFVGKEKAWQAEGTTLGTMIMRPTAPIKSKES